LNMDIVKFKREQEQYFLHLQRLRNVKPVISTSTPESLGLKHLAVRPKKQQMIADRRQTVAKENAKLMQLMTNIMEEKRQQPKYVRLKSLNEVERKLNVDKLNFENSLMLHRLKTVPSVISVAELEEDFQKHLHAESHLRKRQMKPMSLPKDLQRVNDKSSLFDSSTYASQHENYSQLTFENSATLSDSPIQSMADFRKHVLNSKRNHTRTDSNLLQPQSTAANNYSMMRDASINRDESLFEISHAPQRK